MKPKCLPIVLVVCLSGFFAHANHSILDTGNLLERGEFKAHFEAQFLTSNDSGFNLKGHLDTGLTKDSGLRGVVGIGKADLHIGGFYKWAPIPDIDEQPAMTLLAGVTYSSFSGANHLSLRLHPILSKTFEIELGEVTPYGSLPIGVRSSNEEGTHVPLQLVLGAELKTLHWEKVTFMGEISFDIQHTSNYISFSANFVFDEEGIQFE